MRKDDEWSHEYVSTDITVEPLVYHDIPNFVSLARQIVKDSAYHSDEEKKIILGMTTPNTFEDRLNDKDNFYIMTHAKSNGNTIGFASGRVVDYEGLPNVAYLTWIGVDANHRGRNVAGKLLKASEDSCRNAGISTVTCFIKDGNQSSISAFAKQGYQVDSRIPPTTRGNTGGKFYSKEL